MVGAGFQPDDGGTPHYKTVKYRPNNTTTDGNILIWVCNTDGTYSSGTFYASNALAVTDGTDEDGTETLSFTDLAGHMVLRRQKLSGSNLDTYYIYNNAGMISYIVPPLATNDLTSSYSLTAAPVVNLVFQFTYDTMGRLITKTVRVKGL